MSRVSANTSVLFCDNRSPNVFLAAGQEFDATKTLSTSAYLLKQAFIGDFASSDPLKHFDDDIFG